MRKSWCSTRSKCQYFLCSHPESPGSSKWVQKVHLKEYSILVYLVFATFPWPLKAVLPPRCYVLVTSLSMSSEYKRQKSIIVQCGFMTLITHLDPKNKFWIFFRGRRASIFYPKHSKCMYLSLVEKMISSDRDLNEIRHNSFRH